HEANAMNREIAAEPGPIAVCLDRHGTLIEEVDYLERVDQVALYSWSIDGVRLLNRAGVLLLSASSRRGGRSLPAQLRVPQARSCPCRSRGPGVRHHAIAIV